MTWRRALLGLGVILLAVAVGTIVDYVAISRRVGRVDLALPTSSVPGQTWVIVGLDDRSKVDGGAAADTGATRPGAPTGARADLIVVIHADGDKTSAITISRDLLVHQSNGQLQRLGMFWLLGPQAFVDVLCDQLSVPATHLIAVDLRAFVTIVNTLGGVDVNVPHAMADYHAGLKISAGQQTLDGRTALAYVRSRQGWIKQGGTWVLDPEGAAGRERRGSELIAAVLAKAKSASPLTWQRLAWRAAPDLTLDSGTSLASLMALRDTPTPVALPVDQVPQSSMAEITPRTAAGLVAAGFGRGCTPASP